MPKIKGQYPNKLFAMVEACGKRPADLERDAGIPKGLIHQYGHGYARPSERRAKAICDVLAEWAGREVPISAIFPQLATREGRVYIRPPRDEAAIAAILGGLTTPT